MVVIPHPSFTLRSTGHEGALLPTIVSPDQGQQQQRQSPHTQTSSTLPLPDGQASAFFGYDQTPPPPSYHQSFSSLATPPRRRSSFMDDKPGQRVSAYLEGRTDKHGVSRLTDPHATHSTHYQQLRRGSTSFSSSIGGGRDALTAATIRALPVTLTYAPYGFCLVSRFPFINSLRAPLAALFEQVGNCCGPLCSYWSCPELML